MPTNPFFQNYSFINEQNLFEDLTVESIQIAGVDTFYITRSSNNFNQILNEDDVTIFDKAFEIEAYVKSVDSFEGEGDFLSKFGLEIRDQITFSIAVRTFEKHVSRHVSNLKRPLEGDLIFFPMNKKFFKIMHVEHEAPFYQHGILKVYDIKCELFSFSNERIQTGNKFVDNFYKKYSQENASNLYDLKKIDPIANNIVYENEMFDILDKEEINFFTTEINFPTDYPITADNINIFVDNEKITTDLN